MNYKHISRAYDELYLEEQLYKLEIIKENIKIKGKVLDVGCGTGISTRYFNAIGVDPCKELIEAGSGDLRLGKAEDLKFKEKKFDFVISISAIHNFDNYSKGLSEMSRVLKDKGKAVITLLKKSKKFDEISIAISRVFIVYKTIDEGKDLIFFCRKRI